MNNNPDLNPIQPWNPYLRGNKPKTKDQIIQERKQAEIDAAEAMARYHFLMEQSAQQTQIQQLALQEQNIPCAGGLPTAFYKMGLSIVASPSTGVAPYTSSLYGVLADDPAGTEIYRWSIDGVTIATTQNTTYGLANTQSYVVVFEVTNSTVFAQSATTTIDATIPVVTAGFTIATGSNGVAPVTASFTNTSTVTGVGTKTYLWAFDGTASANANPTAHGFSTGSYPITMSVTESSFGVSARATSLLTTTTPSISLTFTGSRFGVTADGFTGSFTSSVTYNSSSTSAGTLSGLWDFGNLTSSVWVSDAGFEYVYSGSSAVTTSLALTESKYNLVSNLYTRSFSQSLA